MADLYPVYEEFWTIQGEGVHMGRRMHLIRLMGCDQQCPWCDAAGTWHKDYMPSGTTYMSPSVLLKHHGANDTILITGGEPTLYDLEPLTTAARKLFVKVHLETAGHHKISGKVDWLTVSPKLFDGAQLPLPSVLRAADEIKLIIESPENLNEQLEWLVRQKLHANTTVWLHPEWGKRDNPVVLRAILDAVLWNTSMFSLDLRAGWQIHKQYLADPNPQGTVIPLGGDPKKGPSI